jgi:hypothetical protein
MYICVYICVCVLLFLKWRKKEGGGGGGKGRKKPKIKGEREGRDFGRMEGREGVVNKKYTNVQIPGWSKMDSQKCGAL